MVKRFKHQKEMQITRMEAEPPFKQMVCPSRYMPDELSLRVTDKVTYSSGSLDKGCEFMMFRDGRAGLGVTLSIQDTVALAKELLYRYAPEKLK